MGALSVSEFVGKTPVGAGAFVDVGANLSWKMVAGMAAVRPTAVGDGARRLFASFS